MGLLVPARETGDATWLLTAYLILLLAIPAPMVITALGQVGGPATILAVGLLLLWCWLSLRGATEGVPGPGGVPTASVAFLLTAVVAYAHSASLPLPADERSPADGFLLRIAGFVGVVCLTAQCIPTLDRLWALVRRLVLAVGLLALLAVVQIVTGQTWVEHLDLPGLSPGDMAGLQARGAITRPSGTATHPIEFAAVLSVALPYVLAVAARKGAHRNCYMGVALLVGLTILTTGSRTSIVCGAVAFLAMIPSWSWRVRIAAGVALACLGGLVIVAMPGAAGTVRGLFVTSANDPSVLSRTNSYHVVAEFWQSHVWLGRGMGTFLPRYWILDNQYLGVLVGAGLLGIASLLWLIFSALRDSTQAARRATDSTCRTLAIAARASVLSGAVSLALFDVFSFAQAAGLFFLSLGMAGSIERLGTRGGLRVDQQLLD